MDATEWHYMTAALRMLPGYQPLTGGRDGVALHGQPQPAAGPRQHGGAARDGTLLNLYETKTTQY